MWRFHAPFLTKYVAIKYPIRNPQTLSDIIKKDVFGDISTIIKHVSNESINITKKNKADPYLKRNKVQELSSNTVFPHSMTINVIKG